MCRNKVNKLSVAERVRILESDRYSFKIIKNCLETCDLGTVAALWAAGVYTMACDTGSRDVLLSASLNIK